MRPASYSETVQSGPRVSATTSTWASTSGCDVATCCRIVSSSARLVRQMMNFTIPSRIGALARFCPLWLAPDDEAPGEIDELTGHVDGAIGDEEGYHIGGLGGPDAALHGEGRGRPRLPCGPRQPLCPLARP